ncbi:DUF305 domain-containing protein [Pedobacter frigiditerrae]|uniref:DUF305 domain-containing protein n=1 Tax=Pedobacter frigiditerrae TaxID=2530452 RepID=UPI00292F3157|nr:DUF305 domain-containing protein [Pedobacter frigiditerrae]
MKTITILLAAMAITISACNQAEKTDEKMDHSMSHQPTKAGNVMMDAMDESMMAMHKAKQTGNADYDFASMMIPHHEGAIKMAEALLKEGKSAALIDFSNKVITAQQREISLLKDFLKTASQEPNKEAAAFKKAIDSSMAPMMDGMAKVKLTGDIDKDFVALMIPHHQSAVDMAKAYLPFANNAQIKAIAEQILKAQEEEIKWLQKQ